MKRKISNFIMVIGLVAVAVGLLMAIWMQVLAPDGKKFDAIELGMAIAWSGLITAAIGLTIDF